MVSVFIDHTEKKEILNVKRRDGAQLGLTDGWIIHCKQLSCEIRFFFLFFFWLRIVQKQIVVLLSARYINLLLQACVNRGTLVHFASQLLVQHYFSSKIKWLNHLQIKSNKQVIINVLGFTRALGLCAYTHFFLEKYKQLPKYPYMFWIITDWTELSPKGRFSQLSERLKTRDVTERSILCQGSVTMHWRQQPRTRTLPWIPMCFKEFSPQIRHRLGKWFSCFFLHFLYSSLLFTHHSILVSERHVPSKTGQIGAFLTEWSSSWVL